MKLLISFWKFEMCIRTKRMFDVQKDDMVDPCFNLRFGHWVYSMEKGWRNWVKEAQAARA